MMLILMLNTNAVMLNSLVVFTDIISSSQTIAIFNALNNEILLGNSVVDIICSTGNTLQRVTLGAVPVLFAIRRLLLSRGDPNE